jgi:hypothetical protein
MIHEASSEGSFIGTGKPTRDLCLQFNSTGRGLLDVNSATEKRQYHGIYRSPPYR